MACSRTGEQGHQIAELSTTVRIWSSQDNQEEGERKGDGLGRGSPEPLLAKCKLFSLLGKSGFAKIVERAEYLINSIGKKQHGRDKRMIQKWD